MVEKQQGGANRSRRDLLRGALASVVGAAGLASFVDGIASGHFSKSTLGLPLRVLLSDRMSAVQEAAGHVDTARESPVDILNKLGTTLFASGVYGLAKGKHLTESDFGLMALLTGAKYYASDRAGKSELVQVTDEGINALVVMVLAVSLADGLNGDVEATFKRLREQSPTQPERVALMMGLATCLSPLATTLKSATIVGRMAKELVGDDTKLMTICVSHVANLSGILLFGDPPFLAVIEKFGFAEAVSWQARTMWPIAIHSLFTSTYKINCALNCKNGMSPQAARCKALTDTRAGLLSAAPVIARYMKASLQNLAMYFVPGTHASDAHGMAVSLGEALMKKFQKAASLPFDTELPQAPGGDGATMFDGGTPEVRAVNDVLAGWIDKLPRSAEQGAESKSSNLHDSAGSQIRAALRVCDYARVGSILERALQMDSVQTAALVAVLKDLNDNNRVDQSTEGVQLSSIQDVLGWCKTAYDRGFSMHRVKAYLGGNVADILNIFPFQAGCINFLVPVFEKLVNTLVEKTRPAVQEANISAENHKAIILYLLVMAFSGVADNYVACKVGLHILPSKPEVALLAAVQGGALTAIGNMANVALFELDDYSLAQSLKNIGVHLPDVAVNAIWATILGYLADDVSILSVRQMFRRPQPKTRDAHAANETSGTDRPLLARILQGRVA